MGDKRLREHQLQHVIWLQRPLGEDAELYLARSGSKDHPNLGREPDVPSGKLTVCYGKSPFLMGKSTISMAIFNSFLYVYQRVSTISEAPGHESVQLVPITPISLWFMVRK